MSWPPNTTFVSGGSAGLSKSGWAVTQPSGAANPARSASAPVIAVVATEPRTPISHIPARTRPPLADCSRRRGGAPCIDDVERGQRERGAQHGVELQPSRVVVDPAAINVLRRRQDVGDLGAPSVPCPVRGVNVVYSYRIEGLRHGEKVKI